MSAITSENKRRQKLLGSAQVNHIDAYTRLYREGAVTQAMPHLLLVVDEFAELKKEEPEFMQEIISLAQVGRSLGMHLILATQKPAGTVDEKIWMRLISPLPDNVTCKLETMSITCFFRRATVAEITGKKKSIKKRRFCPIQEDV